MLHDGKMKTLLGACSYDLNFTRYSMFRCEGMRVCVCRYNIQQNNRVGFVLLPLWFLHFWMTLGVTLDLSHTGSTCQDDDERTVTMPRKGSGKWKDSCVLQSACAILKKHFLR